MSKKRSIWVPIAAGILVIAIAAAAVFVWQSKNAKVVDVFPVYNLYDTYWGDTSTLDGNVTAGKAQNVLMQEGLIESINVSVGDTVSPGDVLMVYDTTSFQLTLQSDQAAIALLESNLQLANRNLADYKGLKPAENAPQPTEEIIDNGALHIRGSVTEADYSSGEMSFLCDVDTVISAGFLRALRDNGGTAQFQLYEDNTLYGSWIVEGDALPATKTEYERIDLSDYLRPAESTDPETGTPIGATPAPEGPFYREVVSEAIQDDFTLGEFLSMTGDGFSTDSSVEYAAYGQLIPCAPTEYERFETVYHDNYVPDGSENYLYTKAELAEMIKQTEEEIASLQLELKMAQITYQKDQLVGKTGQVTAAVSGTVTEVNDPASLALGDTLIAVKGAENYSITTYISEMNLSKVAIGDSLDVYTYESGSSVTATISEIDTTPVTDAYYGWNENPNNSYYPVVATVDDPDAELTIGEWCEVTLAADDAEAGGIYLPLMYVRKDGGGSFVMLADEDGLLRKQYVSTGKTLWGYEIEIRGGVTLEDRIAFPYGKAVKEGAPTQDLEYPEFW